MAKPNRNKKKTVTKTHVIVVPITVIGNAICAPSSLIDFQALF